MNLRRNHRGHATVSLADGRLLLGYLVKNNGNLLSGDNLVTQLAIHPTHVAENNLRKNLRLGSFLRVKEFITVVKDNLVQMETVVNQNDELLAGSLAHLGVSEEVLDSLEEDVVASKWFAGVMGDDEGVDIASADVILDSLAKGVGPRGLMSVVKIWDAQFRVKLGEWLFLRSDGGIRVGVAVHRKMRSNFSEMSSR
jgi:hypothetical protein